MCHHNLTAVHPGSSSAETLDRLLCSLRRSVTAELQPRHRAHKFVQIPSGVTYLDGSEAGQQEGKDGKPHAVQAWMATAAGSQHRHQPLEMLLCKECCSCGARQILGRVRIGEVPWRWGLGISWQKFDVSQK